MSMPATTVGELRQLFEGVPDNTPLVGGLSDHTWRPVEAKVTTALCQPGKVGWNRRWVEDYGEELTPEATYGPRVQVLAVE